MRRLLFALVVVIAALCGGEARAATGSWIGSFRLPASADPVEVLVRFTGGHATVSMGYGHPARSVVPVKAAGSRVRFTLPASVSLDGNIKGRTLTGTVRQGSVRGTFRLARGT